MKALRMFLLINAALAGILGLVLLVMPDQFGTNMGIVMTPYASIFAKTAGGVFFGLGILMGMSYRVKDAKALQGIIAGGLVLHILNAITDAMATHGGVINAVGWVDVAVHVLLACGFLFFLLKTPTK